MSGKVYQVFELVGTSEESIEDAINRAISHGAQSYGKLDWYELIQTRGYIENNKHKYYQVLLKIGCHAH